MNTTLDFKSLQDKLNGQVWHQPHAVSQVALRVISRLNGYDTVKRPCVFLLVGPSGHGKSSLPTALCEALFGSTDKSVFQRVAMTVAGDEHGGALNGSTAGLMGSDAAGILARFLERAQDSKSPTHERISGVLLLDEIDRGIHIRSLSLFLSSVDVFDQGM